MTGDATAVFALYRSFHRQIRLLPTEYLRKFFRLKLTDDVRAILDTKDSELRAKKVFRVRKEASKMERANMGNASRFGHFLDIAYGRKGPLRYELMTPLLSDPNVPLPPPIIPSVEKSRPPVYSPELAALLTTSNARKGKGVSHTSIAKPPKLPERVYPTSEEARLLGPFSKRREVNTRWRYFTEQWKKVYPPSHVSVEEKSRTGEITRSSELESLRRAGIRGVGMQGTGIPEDVEALATPPPRRPPRLARQPRKKSEEGNPPTPPEIRSPLPNRFVRRRYQELLGRMPVLTYHYTPRPEPDALPARNGRYQVSMSPLSINASLRWTPTNSPPITHTNLAWIQHAEKMEEEEKIAIERARDIRRAQRKLDTQADGIEADR